MMEEEIKVLVADASHEKYVDTILKTIEDASSHSAVTVSQVSVTLKHGETRAM